MRERLPLPDKIRNAPQLFLGLELFYGAFLDLCTCRSGFGDGPISWKSVEEYCMISEFSVDQKDDLHYFITKMDEEYLKWRQRQDGKKST
jgi:hypothetical protein